MIPVNHVLAGLRWQVTFITFPKKKKSRMIKVLHELQEMFRVVGIPPVQKCQELLKQIMYVILAMFSFVLAFFSICIRFMLLFLSSLTDHVLLRCNTFQAVNKILNTSYTKCYWKKFKKKARWENLIYVTSLFFITPIYEWGKQQKQTNKKKGPTQFTHKCQIRLQEKSNCLSNRTSSTWPPKWEKKSIPDRILAR